MEGFGRPSDHRRKWDRETYKKLASDRIKAELEAANSKDKCKNDNAEVKLGLLQQRQNHVDLQSNLGKFTFFTKNTPQSQSGGYYCKECDCVVKDSISYLDHINGKSHQQNLGMSLRVERSTLEQVKNRLANNKKKMAEEVEEYNLQKKLKEIKDMEDQTKIYRKEKKQEKKRKADQALEDNQDIDPEMAKLMGFTGFGSSKR